MPSRIAELCDHDVATLNAYAEVCEGQWQNWQSRANNVRMASGDRHTLRFYEDEAAFWLRFAGMLRGAMAEAEAVDRRMIGRRSA
ncbi:hypothetical protein RD149_15680 [Gordonia westfalica]|uniref:TY-Chap C-terminal domain-containing protein n=1 Tax=Gordonia westfalica TaxID=158898 RepID=A0ABU2GW75_9ACTN|nr:hypothetical protein [Gordonia westfalica]MDS1115204.1 hypothetical protein [Gordonia westfalica]